MIPKNIGNPDRMIRVVVGLGFCYVAVMTSGLVSVIFWVLTLVALVTGLVGWCAIYALYGFNTLKLD